MYLQSYIYIYIYIINIEIMARHWYQILSDSDDKYKVFSRTNRSHFVLDTSQLWQVVDIHEQFQDIMINSQAGYYHIRVDNERT